MGWLGGGLLVGLLASLGLRRIRGASIGLGLLLAFAYTQTAESQGIFSGVLFAFTNGSVAEAGAMNENFAAVEVGVNAALTTGSVSVPNTFTDGTTADAEQVNANFTAVVDGVNTALANRENDCVGTGGTWDAGTSTCTPSYNCFIGAFCAAAALEYPPAQFGYINLYDGHTQTTEPALGAGCNGSSGSLLWDHGAQQFAAENPDSYSWQPNVPSYCLMCQ